MHFKFRNPMKISIMQISIKGAGGGGGWGLHQDFLEIGFLVVSDREE